MGHDIRISCSNCNFSGEYSLGCAMKDCKMPREISRLPEDQRSEAIAQITEWRIEARLGYLSQEQLSEVNALREKQKATNSTYVNDLCQCPECKRLESHPRVKIMFENGTSFESSFSCRSCNEKLEWVSESDLDEVQCPHCKGRHLTSKATIFWD